MKGGPSQGTQATDDGDDQIGPGGKRVAVLAEVLAERPLDAISDGSAAGRAADDDTEANPAAAGVRDVEREGPRSHPPTGLQRSAEVCCPHEPSGPRKAALPLTPGPQTVRRHRPLARRRFSTFRPAGVLIRSRNPCVRLRLLRFG